MPTTPLQPFQNPFDTLANLGIHVPTGGILTITLIIVFALWLIYTLVVIYHWLRYSHASVIAFPALFVHLAVSVGLMSYALTGNVIPTFV
ncbi:MAG: hypothetical protein Q7R54_02105 [bacterium]|nr:hypothetical protein [bacterium]